MLDDRFIAIARGLAPSDKNHSIFLSRLRLPLDENLARIPPDGPPAPVAYASRSVATSPRQHASTLRKTASKTRQRVLRANRPPAGDEILASKVVEHWQK